MRKFVSVLITLALVLSFCMTWATPVLAGTSIYPTVNTSAASGVETDEATLNGSVNDYGVAVTSITFDYGLTAAYGSTIAATPASITAGSGATSVTGDISGLTPGTTYHFRVNAVYAGGTTNGSDLTFTTLAPTATTAAASIITINGAMLNGSVNDNGVAITSVTFDYGLTVAYGSTIRATPPLVPPGTGATGVSGAISGLIPGTEYHFRVNAVYTGGPTHGSDMTFTTLVPTATTVAATSVTSNGATLNGSVNGNGIAITSVNFDFGATAGYGETITASPPSVSAGAGSTSVTADLSSYFAPGTTWHFRVTASYSGGITYGSDMTFTTLVPTATTVAATSVTSNGATLNGSVNANYVPETSVGFDYGLTAAYGTTIAATPFHIFTLTGATSVTGAISGLSPGTTYHFRVNVEYGLNIVYGSDMTFTTLAPTATTAAANSIIANGATLNGSVNDNGIAITPVTFEYGLTTAYGTTITASPPSVSAGAGPTSVSVALSSLTPGTTYHFRVNAVYAGGTTHGADMTFTTMAPTATTAAASVITATGATLNGSVNDNGFFNVSTITFEYGVTAAYGSTIAATPSSLTAGTGVTGVSAAISGLTPGTTYHFRVNAIYTGGTTHGADMTFTTYSYTLTYIAGAHGSISGTSPQFVVSGGSGTIVTAVPDTGWHFVSWSDAVGTAARTDTNVVADISVTANFAINTYTLTYTAGAHGSISGTSPQFVVSGGSGTTVTAVPDTGWHFVSWSDAVGTAARTDTSVIANISVTANFAINIYTLTYTAGAHGSISGTSPQMVNYNTAGTTVTAIPVIGYHFVNWSDAVATAARTDTNVIADISVTANFAINTYTLTYTAGANGSISGTSPQTVNYGAAGTTVTAVPSTGCYFVNWSDGLGTATRTDTNATANISVTANFAINIYTLTYTAGANGTITGPLSQPVYFGAYGTTVTAVPAANYHFVNWSDGLTASARTDINVTSSISVTANFAINTNSLTYTAGANGTVTGTSPQTVNYGTAGTTVTAVPDTGYHFVSWSDGITAVTRTDTFVTANISVTANFVINISTTTTTPVTTPTTTPTTTTPVTTPITTPVTTSTTTPSTFVSSDNNVSVTIPSGVIGHTASGATISQITITPVTSPPAPPDDANGIGLCYDFGPNGANFSDTISITIKYDPLTLPVGTDQSKLYIAWWDTTTGKWINLSSVVDQVNHTITVKVTHFTNYSAFALKTPARGFAWVIAGILGSIIIIIGLVAWMVIRRRRLSRSTA
jgi:hypothetical protein